MFGRIGGAAIALGLIAAVSGPLAQERIEPALEGQPEPAPEQQESSPASQQDTTPEHESSPDLLSAIQGIEAAVRDLITEKDDIARHQQEQRDIADLRAQEKMARWAFWVFVATALTVIVTAIGVALIWKTLKHTAAAATYTKVAADAAVAMLNEAEKTTSAAIRTADSAIAANTIHRGSLTLQHRAWLKIMRVEIVSPLRWVKSERQLGEITFRAIAKNVGTTPAVEVFLHIGLRQPRSSVYQTGVLNNNSQEILQEELALAQRMRSMHGSASNITLFRGEILPQQWLCSIPDSDIIINPRTGEPRDTSNNAWYQNIIMGPLLIVYVDYRLVFLKEYHRTVEIYSLRRTTPGTWMTPAEGDIPAEELAIERLAFGGTYTN